MSDLSSRPLLPTLSLPRSHLVDPLLAVGGGVVPVDAPRDEHAELCALEREAEANRKAIAKSYADIKPMGTKSH